MYPRTVRRSIWEARSTFLGPHISPKYFVQVSNGVHVCSVLIPMSTVVCRENSRWAMQSCHSVLSYDMTCVTIRQRKRPWQTELPQGMSIAAEVVLKRERPNFVWELVGGLIRPTALRILALGLHGSSRSMLFSSRCERKARAWPRPAARLTIIEMCFAIWTVA